MNRNYNTIIIDKKNLTKIKYKQRDTDKNTEYTDPSICFGRHTHDDIINTQYTNPENNKKVERINFFLQPLKLQNNPYQEQPKRSDNKQFKINRIRKNNNLTKQEIATLKARVNKLRHENQKNKRKTMSSYDQIEHMLTTKYHSLQKQRHKSTFLQRRKSEQEQAIQKTKLAKVTLHKEVQLAKQRNLQQKKLNAKRVKSTISQQQNLRKEEQKTNLFINISRVQQIKLYQLQHRNKMNMYVQRSRIRAKSNHENKIGQYVKQRQILQKTKRSLKKQQNKLVEQWRRETQNLKQIESKIYEIKNLTDKSHRTHSLNNQKVRFVTKFMNYQ